MHVYIKRNAVYELRVLVNHEPKKIQLTSKKYKCIKFHYNYPDLKSDFIHKFTSLNYPDDLSIETPTISANH